ncbi:MAG: ABC transporter ATP-binding protein [Gammaproteobacteria bacterium]
MIKLEHVTKSYKRYVVHYNTFKSFLLNFCRYKKETEKIDVLNAVYDMSLNIKQSEILCVTGPNGAGKSTLAKLVAGTIVPSEGRVIVSGLVVPFLELGVAFSNELTALDNLYLNGTLLGLSLRFLRKHKCEIFDFAEISDFMHTPLKYYSSGMQLRLAFSIAMHAKGDIYIFDEILAVGDASFQKKCFRSFDNLLAQKKTIVIVSHDLDFIKKHATQVLVMSSGKHHIIEDVSILKNISNMENLLNYCSKIE